MTDSGDRHLGPDPNGRLGAIIPGARSVEILADPAHAATFAGQALLSLLVDLVARQFDVVSDITIGEIDAEVIDRAFPRPQVYVEHVLGARLLALGRSVAGDEIPIALGSSADAAVVVWVGPGDPPKRGSSLTVRAIGAGWKAYCSTNDPAPWAGVSDVPFGPHLAACLAADRVFRLLRSAPVGGTTEIDLSGETLTWDAPGPSLAGLVLPSSYLLGLGAVAAAFANSLAATDGVSGAIVGVDPQASDLTNRNRLLSMAYMDLDFDKAELTARLFAATAMEFYPNVTGWPDYYTDPRRRAPDDLLGEEEASRYRWVISAVDKNLVRRNIANVLPRHVLAGSTDGLVAQATSYSMVGESECLACNHPVPTFDIESLSAELLTLSADGRRVRLVDEMGASLEDWAAIEDYLRDPSCATVGEAALRRLGVEGTIDWSVGFVSAAAGVMLAAAFIRAARDGPEAVFAEGPEQRVIFWGTPELISSRARRRAACALCADAAIQARFAERW